MNDAAREHAGPGGETGPRTPDADDDATEAEPAGRSRLPTPGAGWLAVGALLTAILTVLVLADQEAFERTTVGDLAGLLIGGLLTFLFGTGATVATFNALGLSQVDQPLGLPAGTIQAFIALFLILLFFVMSTFLYLNVSQTNVDPVLRNLTQEEVEQIPTDQIAATTSTSVEVPGVDADGNPTTEGGTEHRVSLSERWRRSGPDGRPHVRALDT
jgi:hypothetical protein